MSNEVIKLLKNHRSIRYFEPRKIEKEVLTEILEAGIRTANAGNLQQYSLVVIDDPEKIHALGLYDAPLIIIALTDAYRTDRWFKVYGENDVDVNTLSSFMVNNWDAIICIHSINIAAESLGLGGVYIGCTPALDLKGVINNPENTFPIAMLCLGYPNEEGRLSDRLPLDAVVHHNSYKIPTDEEIKKWYSEKEWIFHNRNSKERLEKFDKQGVHSMAEAYAKNKFIREEMEEDSEEIKKNIMASGYKIF